jgi:hypothetical protein
MARMIRLLGRASPLTLLVLAVLAACVGDECPEPIYAYCASVRVLCPMTWQAAQDPGSWPCGDQIALKVCEDVWIAFVAGPDPGDAYYYNPKDGSLYRVQGHDASTGETTCLGGEGEVFDCVTSTTALTGTKGCP